VIVYHGTSHYLASRITSAGFFRAAGAGIYNKRGAVFFTDHRGIAEQYAVQRGDGTGVVFKVDVPKRWLRDDGGALIGPGEWYRIYHTARNVPAEMIVEYYEVERKI
jgi:hypothetical protein